MIKSPEESILKCPYISRSDQGCRACGFQVCDFECGESLVLFGEFYGDAHEEEPEFAETY